MTDMGIVLSGGSDAPCTLPDPIAGIYAACNHYIPEQSLTIPEALKLFTCNAAWTTFDEKERGISGDGENRRYGHPEPESADDETGRTSGPEG